MNTGLTDEQRQALEHVERARGRRETQRLCPRAWSRDSLDLRFDGGAAPEGVSGSRLTPC